MVVDSWNVADPQKIIDLVPVDIRPYTVLLLSFSVSHSGVTPTGQCIYDQVENAADTARAWLKVAAQNRMWAMVQASSGGFSHFPDYDPGTDLHNTIYGEFFRDYPNFLGFNYAEQFWGFGWPCASSLTARWHHFANLLKLTHAYGGYLAVSFTGGPSAANPLAMVKNDTTLEPALRQYGRNFIMEEKFTSTANYLDNESTSLGMFLSGYAGQLGIRPDNTGWTNLDGSRTYPSAADAPHLIEHLSMDGETVFDGPEQTNYREIQTLPYSFTTDGYITRRWGLFPEFVNNHLDIYRRILDGTLRILSRQQVIDRTKVAIVNDVKTGSDHDKFASPMTLYDGLYLADGDGTYLTQRSWFKKTGRYATIPTIWRMADGSTPPFHLTVNTSSYQTRWPTTAAKVNEFNTLYPQEYSGNIYAGRQGDIWITYNPYKTNQTASGTIPLRDSACRSVGLTYAPYTTGVMKVSAQQLQFYLTNYDASGGTTKVDRIAIGGGAARPNFTFADTGAHPPSAVSAARSGGQYVITVSHNGPLKLTVNCAGGATDPAAAPRLVTSAPSIPPVYTGVHQYEAEYFDFRNVGSMVANGALGPVRNYQGLGYMNFGTSATASMRYTVNVSKAGVHQLTTRYATAPLDVTSVDIYVNGSRAATPTFTATASPSDWGAVKQNVTLKAGANVIEFRSTGTRRAPIYFDNIVLTN